jgi:hypothetical protein
MRRRRKHEARHLILKADTPHPHPLARNKSSSWTRRDMMNRTCPRAPASLDPWQRDVSCVDAPTFKDAPRSVRSREFVAWPEQVSFFLEPG